MVKLGQLLHQERVRKKLTITDVSKGTKIKEIFLVALERGEYHKLPSPAYAKGFVTNYAAFLGLSRSEVIALFRREFDEKRAYKVLPDSLTQPQTFPKLRIKIKDSLLIVCGLVVVFFGFLLFQYRAAFIAPPLQIISPKDGAMLSQDITVAGQTDREATVIINNQLVSVNSRGEFSKQLTFFPGKTTITVTAKNRFGKETVVTREITIK